MQHSTGTRSIESRTSTQYTHNYGKMDNEEDEGGGGWWCENLINFYSISFQYKKPELVAQMERETLRILQDVETEVDDDTDIDLMKQLLGSVANAPNAWE